jgi:hypothetical protein
MDGMMKRSTCSTTPPPGASRRPTIPDGQRLADVRSLDPGVVPPNGDRDLVPARRLPEEAAVQEGGVRDVEGVLERVPQWTGQREIAADGRIVAVDGREPVRRPDRCRVGRRVHPHEPVVLGRRVRLCATRLPIRLAGQRGNEATGPRRVELPAVVAALKKSVRNATGRQRHVAMRAAVEKRTCLTAPVAKEHERRVLDGARARLSAERRTRARDEPLMGQVAGRRHATGR